MKIYSIAGVWMLAEILEHHKTNDINIKYEHRRNIQARN